MVRIHSEEYVDGRRDIYATGDSDDTKPTENICDGSVFVETDTAVVSFYNETAADWIPTSSSASSAEDET